MASVINTVSLENKDEWRKVRESLPKHVVFGSVFPSWFGHGYDSLAQVVDTLHGRREKENKDDDFFLKRALDHGVTFEKYAIDGFIELLREVISQEEDEQKTTLITPFYGLPSTHYQLDKDPNVQMFLTPDAFMVVRNGVTERSSTAVIEAKCPTRKQHLYESVEDWTRAFREQHPRGYPKAFLQAALYSAVDLTTTEFFVVYCFVHEATNMSRLIAHGFKMTDQLREWCLDNAQQFSRCLQEGHEKLRVPSSRKAEALGMQEKTWNITMVSESEFICYADVVDSNEQDGSDAGQ